MRKNKSILTIGHRFAGYYIKAKLSIRHDGEREVYHGVDAMGEETVVTVYNLNSPRYASKEMEQKPQADGLPEVQVLKNHEGLEFVAPFIGCGVSRHGKRKLVWMAQKFMPGRLLDEEIRSRKIIGLGDAVRITRDVANVVGKIARFSNSGGHYNISTDNIIVSYKGDELTDVRLVGFTNIGTSYSGNTPIVVEELDKRFRAPETGKGIHNHRSDVFSLGMVLLLMLTGYPKIIETERFSVDFGSLPPDLSDISSTAFYKALWKVADKNLSNALRLVLRKATDISPTGRFATIDKFNEFLTRVEKKKTEVHSVKEDVENRAIMADPLRHPVVPLIGGKRELVGTHSEAGYKESKKRALDEVAGMSELKELFRRDFIRIVRNPKVAQAYGIKPSNCTLLYGPQGCGKTFIAEKAAQESGLKYKIINPSELASKFIHGTQEKIAELFAEAEKNGPMILIFDEFDAIVPKRDNDLTGNQANEVNEMLTQMNNCASRGIYVLATTNRPGLLDPAIMRKGRVDRTVYVSLPDMEARAELFRLEIEKRPFVDMDYELLAKETDNYTGSDISYIVEESARLCFEETLDRGLEEPLPLSMSRLMKVIKNTHSSVSEVHRKEYLQLKAKMEDKQTDSDRKKVGFVL